MKHWAWIRSNRLPTRRHKAQHRPRLKVSPGQRRGRGTDGRGACGGSSPTTKLIPSTGGATPEDSHSGEDTASQVSGWRPGCLKPGQGHLIIMESDLEKLLHGTDKKKAQGTYGVSPFLLLHCGGELAMPFTHSSGSVFGPVPDHLHGRRPGWLLCIRIGTRGIQLNNAPSRSCQLPTKCWS